MNLSDIFFKYFDCKTDADVKEFYEDYYTEWGEYNEHYDAVHGD